MQQRFLILDDKLALSPWGGGLRLPDWVRRPKIVLSRRWTYLARESLRGIPLWRRGQFARLTADAKSPFERMGCYAAFERDHVNLWIWDAKLVEDAVGSKGVAADTSRCLPLSVMFQAPHDGVWWASPGIPTVTPELQLWRGGRLIDSRPRFAEMTGSWTDEWRLDPGLLQRGWPPDLPLPAARSLTKIRSAPWLGQWPRAPRTKAPAWVGPAAASLVLAGSAAWAAHWAGTLHAAERALENAEAAKASGLAAGNERASASVAGQRFLARYADAQTFARGARGLPVQQLLEHLGPLIVRQGMFVRELEINKEAVKATLAAVPGASPRLESIVTIIEQSPHFSDARLVDVAGQGGFQFEWRYDTESFRTKGGAK